MQTIMYIYPLFYFYYLKIILYCGDLTELI